jgi:hypothetical protein
MIVRDGGCAFPTCTAKPAWCESHHLYDWIRGGLTNLDDGAPYCDRHHDLWHKGKFTAQRLPDGTLEHRRPDGTIIPPGPSTRPKATHTLFPDPAGTDTDTDDVPCTDAPASADPDRAAATSEDTGSDDNDLDPDDDPAEIERLRQLAKARAQALRAPPPTRAA